MPSNNLQMFLLPNVDYYCREKNENTFFLNVFVVMYTFKKIERNSAHWNGSFQSAYVGIFIYLFYDYRTEQNRKKTLNLH
jgi:hypothetical protein